MIARKTFAELWPLGLVYLIVMEAILVPAVALWGDMSLLGKTVSPVLMFLKSGLFKEVIESTATYDKYFAMQQFFKGGNICGAAAAVLMGTGLIARERENQTMEFLMSRPVSPSRVLFHKFWVAAVIVIAPIYLVGWSGAPLSSWLAGEELSFTALTIASTHNAVFVLSLLVMTTLCSVVFRLQAHAAAAAGLFVVIHSTLFLIQTARQYSYFKLADLEIYGPIIRGERTWGELFFGYQIWILLGSLVAYVLADRLLRRRVL